MKTKKIDDQLATLRNKLAVFTQTRESLLSHKEVINTLLNENYKVIEHINDEINKQLVNSFDTEDEKIKFFLFEDGSVSKYRYNEREKFWTAKLGSNGLFRSGYYRDTNQVSFSIKLNYGDKNSLKTHEKQIVALLPYLNIDSEGKKRFEIFEHTLSACCVYSLVIDESEPSYAIYSNRRKNASFTELKDALKYIQKHHWYEGKEQEEYNDDCDEEDND